MSGYPRQPQQPYPPQNYAQPSNADKAMAILAHLSGPIAAALTLGTLSLIGPLAMWLIYKDRSPAVRYATAGAFNFNLSFWLLYLLSWILIFTLIGALIGAPLLVVISVVALFCHIKGAIRASNNQAYDYPYQIRVLS